MKQYVITDRFKAGKTTAAIHENEELQREAVLAIDMVTRWGMIAGAPDGEDSSGRAKGRLLPPEELIERAFTCAELAFKTARDKGLVLNLPDISELNPPD